MIKDKLFFFGDYQATRSKIGSSFLQSIPTRRSIRSTCGVAGVCELRPQRVRRCQIYDPATGNRRLDRANTFRRQSDSQQPTFAAGSALCCSSSLTPPAPGLSTISPAGGNGIFNNDQFNIRIDDQTTSKLHTFGRYSFANYTLTGAGAFGDLGGNGFGTGGFAGASKSRDQSIAGGFDYAFSPSVLTDFRFGYVRYHVNVVPNGVGTTPATDVGIPGLNTGTDFTSGQPSYFVGNSGGDGTDTGQDHDHGRYQQLRIWPGREPLQLPTDRAGRSVPVRQ